MMKPFDISAEDTERAYPYDMIGMAFNLICVNERTGRLYFSVVPEMFDSSQRFVYVYELSLAVSPRGLGGRQFEHFEKKAVLNGDRNNPSGMLVYLEEAEVPDFEGFAFKDMVNGNTIVLVGTRFDTGLNKFKPVLEVFPEFLIPSYGVSFELDLDSCEL